MDNEESADLATIDGLFGKRFAEARKDKGLSQEAIVSELEKRGYSLHITAVGKIERGERRVTVGEAAALADTLNFTLDAMIGGQGKLLTAYAINGRERDAFTKQAAIYARSFFDIAVAADGAQLRDADRDWLSTELANQTPAQLTHDAIMHVEAAITREGLDATGKYAKSLLESMKRDDEALQRNRVDHTAWRRKRLEGNGDG